MSYGKYLCINCAYGRSGTRNDSYSATTKDYCYYCDKYCEVRSEHDYDWPEEDKVDIYAE